MLKGKKKLKKSIQISVRLAYTRRISFPHELYTTNVAS